MNDNARRILWKLPLQSNEKLVLRRMSDEADSIGGGICLAVAELAADCGMKERNVQYIVKKLLDLGVLLLTDNVGGGRGKARTYCIDIRRCQELAEEEKGAKGANGAVDCTVSDPEKGANDATDCTLSPRHIEDKYNYLPTDEVKRSEEGARAISPGVEVIRAFDAERVAAYGEHQARAYPAGTDRVFADRWLASGADPDLCRAVFAGAMRRYAQTGRKPPDTLSYFDRAIANAVATKNAPPTEGTAHVQAAKPVSARRETATEATQRRRAGLAAAVDRRLGQP